MTHVLTPGRVAVITGAAHGIGLAAARRCAALGMKVCIADREEHALEEAARALAAEFGQSVTPVVADVSQLKDMERLKEAAFAQGDVAFVMNNAAIGSGGGPWTNYENWQRLLDVNLWGVINGVHTFAPALIAAGAPAAIVNVGSKQGITNPPGNAAYSVSKAAVKTLTEQLAYELRQIDGCKVTAHLLIPGFTFTHMTFPDRASRPKPPAAWTPEQVVEFMEAGMAAGNFYLLCPDNEVTPEMDHRRMLWATGDVVENRPALSRWHPDFKEAFAAYMRGVKTPGG